MEDARNSNFIQVEYKYVKAELQMYSQVDETRFRFPYSCVLWRTVAKSRIVDHPFNGRTDLRWLVLCLDDEDLLFRTKVLKFFVRSQERAGNENMHRLERR